MHKPSQVPLVGLVMSAPDFAPLRYRDVVTRLAAPKPPTLREWLGDRVSELGPWAEVLREQPVPAGYLTAWRWQGSALQFHDGLLDMWCPVLPNGFSQIVERDERPAWMGGDGGCRKFMQKAFFHRHPDVKPEPKLRTWFGNEEEA